MGQRVPIGRRYLPGTMILETTWATRTGWVVVLDLLLIGPWHHDDDRSTSHRRSPTDSDADHVLLRMMSCINGQVEMHVECEPKLDYGRAPVSWEYARRGLRHRPSRAPRGCDAGAAPDDRPAARLRARTGAGAHDAARGRHGVRRADLDRARGAEELRRRLPADELHGRLLARLARAWRVPRPPVADLPAAQRADAEGPDLRADRRDVRGADDLAAGDPGGERNWDYRYSWIRDSAFMLWGLHSLGFAQEAGDYYYFIEDVASGDRDLQVLYGIGGEREIEEQELPHLEGYEHSQPVRVGNAAYNQNQHDVWGTLLDSVYIHTQNRDQLPESSWPILVRQVEQAIEHWRERDRGIWEVRGEPQHFTSSKVFCWLACDRGARLARLRADAGRPIAGRRPPTRSARTSSPTASTPRELRQHYETTRSTPRCCCCR